MIAIRTMSRATFLRESAAVFFTLLTGPVAQGNGSRGVERRCLLAAMRLVLRLAPARSPGRDNITP